MLIESNKIQRLSVLNSVLILDLMHRDCFLVIKEIEINKLLKWQANERYLIAVT
jgi:hypothetical protein